MQYRELGASGLSISAIGLGTMTWGEQNSRKDAFQQLDCALDHGINFVDTAEMYPVPPNAQTQGLTEQYLGDWLTHSGRRQDVVLATKVTGGDGNNSGSCRSQHNSGSVHRWLDRVLPPRSRG